MHKILCAWNDLSTFLLTLMVSLEVRKWSIAFVFVLTCRVIVNVWRFYISFQVISLRTWRWCLCRIAVGFHSIISLSRRFDMLQVLALRILCMWRHRRWCHVILRKDVQKVTFTNDILVTLLCTVAFVLTTLFPLRCSFLTTVQFTHCPQQYRTTQGITFVYLKYDC